MALPVLLVAGGLSLPHIAQVGQFTNVMRARSSPTAQASHAAAAPARASLPGTSTLPAQDNDLAKKLTTKLATFPTDQQWSVYVEDIASSRAVAINGDTAYQPLALANLFLLAPLESKIPSENWTIRLQDKTLTQCVELMLRSADPLCTQAITRLVNPEYADSFNKNLGFAKTKITKPSDQQTTAREIGRLLALLGRGETLSDKARRHVFDVLYDQKRTPGISVGCGSCRAADVRTIENQTGLTHNAGIVTHGSRSYVLVIMSRGGTFEQVTGLTRMIEAELTP